MGSDALPVATVEENGDRGGDERRVNGLVEMTAVEIKSLGSASATDSEERLGPRAFLSGVPASLTAFLGLLPILIETAGKVGVLRRPYWSHFYDPETIFFYDGVRVLHGQAPLNVDHPGLPTHYLSALIAAVSTSDPLRIDQFRLTAYVVVAVLSFAGAYLLQRLWLQKLDVAWGVAALWVWFSFPTALQWTAVWRTESLYLFFGAFAIVAVVRFSKSRRDVDAALLGASVGLLLSLKLLFLGWIPAALCAVLVGGQVQGARRVRQMLILSGAGLGAFVLVTLPVVDRYPYVIRWVWRLASRGGEYGSGGVGLPGVWWAGEVVVAWIQSAKGWCVVAATLWLWVLVMCHRGSREAGPLAGAIAFSSVALPTSALAMLRGNGDSRYLLAIGLLGLMTCGIAGELTPKRWRAGIGGVLVLVLGLLLGKALRLDWSVESSWARRHAALREELSGLLRDKGLRPEAARIVFSFRFPDPAFALRIMTEDEAMLRRVESRFPRTGHYNPWSRRLWLPAGSTRWDALVVASKDVARLPFPVGEEMGQVGEYRVFAPSRMLASSQGGPYEDGRRDLVAAGVGVEDHKVVRDAPGAK
ncbi:MAG: hypothetical protein DYG91_13210 [Chloroflexi bacterium CFX7]|nr:hypothetical protein [Chloroflexi bacterium CFX7]